MKTAFFSAFCGAVSVLATLAVLSAGVPGASAQTAPSAIAPPPNLAAQLSIRIGQLEAEIRRLTGENEQLNHRIRVLEGRLEKMATDTEFRLRTLEGGPPPQASAQTAPPAPAGSLPGPRPLGPQPSIAGADRGARVLGTVPDPSAAPVLIPPPVKETPEQQYDRAHSLIIKDRDYVQAEKVLSGFISENPEHSLTPNAYYWLGRTYYVRNDFERAAATFAEGFQNHPKSKKASAVLLNLGMSLAQLGKTREACTTYAHLARNFPDAEGAVKRRLAAERKLAKCRR